MRVGALTDFREMSHQDLHHHAQFIWPNSIYASVRVDQNKVTVARLAINEIARRAFTPMEQDNG